MTTMEKEFLNIDVQHLRERRARLEVELLRLLLAEVKGSRMSLFDRWKIQDIVNELPDLADRYGVSVNKKL